MIIAVEGPSATGKTTWCRRHAPEFVAEYTPEPGPTDAAGPADASFWVAVNRGRWRQALDLAARLGYAVCDTDPLKLHYAWCLATVGAAPWADFERELAETRRAFADNALGLPDAVLVDIPPVAALRARRDDDPARRRRSFDLHATLAEPLRAWYAALDAVGPGRVRWELPATGLPADLPGPRPDRCDPALLDALVSALPAGR